MGFYLDSAVTPAGRTRKTATPLSAGVGSGHRYFSPSLGRWLSRDPIGEDGGVHLYVFVGNAVGILWDALGAQPDYVGVAVGDSLTHGPRPGRGVGYWADLWNRVKSWAEGAGRTAEPVPIGRSGTGLIRGTPRGGTIGTESTIDHQVKYRLRKEMRDRITAARCTAGIFAVYLIGMNDAIGSANSGSPDVASIKQAWLDIKQEIQSILQEKRGAPKPKILFVAVTIPKVLKTYRDADRINPILDQLNANMPESASAEYQKVALNVADNLHNKDGLHFDAAGSAAIAGQIWQPLKTWLDTTR